MKIGRRERESWVVVVRAETSISIREYYVREGTPDCIIIIIIRVATAISMVATNENLERKEEILK